MKKNGIYFFLFIIGFAGCNQPSSRLQKISLGQNKKEIVKKIGNPRVVRGAIRNKYDQNIEVWEYRLAMPSDDSAGEIVGKSLLTVITFGIGAREFDDETRDYWLYFLNDELVRWDQAGDWQVESQNLYEVRFTSGHNL